MKELASIQSELNAPKGQYNQFGKYKYRSCEDILAAVKPLLRKQSCTLIVSDDITPCGNRVYVKATATITNAAGEQVYTTAFAREEDAKKGMDASQVTGAASSYARKYALNGLFAIDDTRDADALNTSPQYTQPVQQEVASGKIEGLSLDEIFSGYAQPAIQQAETKKDLLRVYQDYAVLQSHAAFKNALSARRKELGL